jgi:formylglycine-generating enzyme required for sulfatase activity
MTGRGLFSCIALLSAMGSAALAAAPTKDIGVTAASRSPGTKFRDCSDCPEMVVIPAGSFTMGSPPWEEDREDIEGPQHQVTIGRAFAVGIAAVTREEYARFVSETGRGGGDGCRVFDAKQGKTIVTAGRDWRDPGIPQTERDPVVCVDWNDAHAFLAWLNGKVRRARQLPGGSSGPYRLLTEAEWEYAARAGTTTRFWWGEEFSHEHANYGVDCPAPTCGPLIQGSDRWLYTSPVGSFPSNPFGLHDMGGNAWQWVEDCYEDSYNGAPSDGTARTSCTRDIRVSRGGSWISRSRYMRAAARDRIGPDFRAGFLGFRVARTLD